MLDGKGGAYSTYKRDINNNYLQILWVYDWNLKQLHATIRYRVLFSYYGYKLTLPLLNGNINKKNIESYICYGIKVADELMDKYSDKIAKKFPKTPDWFTYY